MTCRGGGKSDMCSNTHFKSSGSIVRTFVIITKYKLVTVHCRATSSPQWHKCNSCYKHFKLKRWQRGRMLWIFKASEYGHKMDRPTLWNWVRKGEGGACIYKHRIKQSLYSYFWYFFSFFVFFFLKKKTRLYRTKSICLFRVFQL